MNRENSRLNRLMHNNKFLLVAAFLLAIVIWASIRANYSDTATRTITDVKVTLQMPGTEDNGYRPFYNERDLYVDIVVSGRSFDINAQALSRDDVAVEAVVGYIDTAGYKTINLSARTLNGSAEITKVTPSSVTLFFDREVTEAVNVKPRLTNDVDTLTKGDYVVEALQTTPRTVNVTGPASVVENLSEVYFEATIEPDQLPLTATKEVNAEVRYDLSETSSGFLTADVDKPVVTVPVRRELKVDTTVSFINQPAVFNDTPPKYTISPSSVLVRTTSADVSSYQVGKINFSDLKSGVNRIELPAPTENSAELQDSVEKFIVTIDLSGYETKTLDLSANVIKPINAGSRSYQVLRRSALRAVTVVGPAQSLEKIDPNKIELQADLQNSGDASASTQNYPVTIVLKPDEVTADCWVSGEYKVTIRVDAES